MFCEKRKKKGWVVFCLHKTYVCENGRNVLYAAIAHLCHCNGWDSLQFKNAIRCLCDLFLENERYIHNYRAQNAKNLRMNVYLVLLLVQGSFSPCRWPFPLVVLLGPVSEFGCHDGLRAKNSEFPRNMEEARLRFVVSTCSWCMYITG